MRWWGLSTGGILICHSWKSSGVKVSFGCFSFRPVDSLSRCHGLLGRLNRSESSQVLLVTYRLSFFWQTCTGPFPTTSSSRAKQNRACRGLCTTCCWRTDTITRRWGTARWRRLNLTSVYLKNRFSKLLFSQMCAFRDESLLAFCTASLISHSLWLFKLIKPEKSIYYMFP